MRGIRANWDWFESMIERMSESQSCMYIYIYNNIYIYI